MPGTTGAFAFADPTWTRDMLTTAGFTDIRFEDRRADMHVGRDVDDAATFITGQFDSVNKTLIRIMSDLNRMVTVM